MPAAAARSLKASLLRALLEFVAERKRIQIVSGQNGHALHLWQLRLDQIRNGFAQGAVIRVKTEQIFVALVEDLRR